MERLIPSINQSKYEDIINKTLSPHDNNLFQIDSNSSSPLKQPVNNNEDFSLFENSPNHVNNDETTPPAPQTTITEELPPPALEQNNNSNENNEDDDNIDDLITVTKKGSADSFSIDNIMNELDIPMADSRADSDFNLDDIENEINASLKDI